MRIKHAATLVGLALVAIVVIPPAVAWAALACASCCGVAIGIGTAQGGAR